MKELQNYVQNIADEIKTIYALDESEREAREEAGEACDLYEYTAESLDIEYTISGKGDFLGVRLAVTLGGPNVWIDTRRGEVFGAWGADRASAWIPSEICDEINAIFCELYECTR